jgi:hypothetical protein
MNENNFFSKLKNKFKEKHELNMPISVLIIGICFIIIPIFSITYKLIMGKEQLNDFFIVFRPIQIAFILISPIIAYGLLRMRRWGWYLMIIFSGSLIIYIIYYIIAFMTEYYWIIMKVTLGFYLIFLLILALIAVIGIFSQKDIYLPYFSVASRGFRDSKRKKIEKDTIIDGKTHLIRDISKKGLLIVWENCEKSPGDIIKFEIDDPEGNEYLLTGKIVRKSEHHIGILLQGPLVFDIGD